MIEAGLDGLQSLQPDARGMDPAALKRAFGGRIVLNGCIDTHHLLIRGTPDLVRRRVREVLETMRPAADIVASPSHDYLLPETSVANFLAMVETVRDFGAYPGGDDVKNPEPSLAALSVVLTPACGPQDAGRGNVRGRRPSPQPPAPLIPEDQVRLSNDPAKTELFRDAGLGLFIHWGPNSQMGTEISWPLNDASDDYVKKYYALAETFDPVHFDPAEWARLAKLAGMEYVVFTAKHHDGFAMFDTAYSDFKITRSPYGKDIAAQVAEAFRKEGILVGFYYSPGDFRYQFETGPPLQASLRGRLRRRRALRPAQEVLRRLRARARSRS